MPRKVITLVKATSNSVDSFCFKIIIVKVRVGQHRGPISQTKKILPKTEILLYKVILIWEHFLHIDDSLKFLWLSPMDNYLGHKGLKNLIWVYIKYLNSCWRSSLELQCSGYDTYFTIKSFRSGSMINIRIFWKKWFLSYRIFYTTLSWYFVYDNIKLILLWRLLLLMIRLAMWSMGLYFIQHD